MNNSATHILQNFPSKEATNLCRASDGMILAVRIQCKVQFGEDPNTAQSRFFMDESYAKAFLRKLADDDQTALRGEAMRATIDERFGPGESGIVIPGEKAVRKQ